MGLLKTGIMASVLVICYNVFGQFNVQTGYNFGFFDTKYYAPELVGKSDNSHRINRLNGRVEYQLKKKLLIGLNTGLDFFDIRHHFETKGDNVGVSSFKKAESIHHSRIQAYRVGLSIGYQYLFNNGSSLCFSVNYDQFFINSVKIIRSDYIKKLFSISEVENNAPYLTSVEHRTMIDLNEIGYRNEFKQDNRHIIFSLEYRYYWERFFMSSTLAISTKNKNPIRSFRIPKRQNLFLFGINLGYTFPQKDQNDEE